MPTGEGERAPVKTHIKLDEQHPVDGDVDDGNDHADPDKGLDDALGVQELGKQDVEVRA